MELHPTRGRWHRPLLPNCEVLPRRGGAPGGKEGWRECGGVMRGATPAVNHHGHEMYGLFEVDVNCRFVIALKS